MDILLIPGWVLNTFTYLGWIILRRFVESENYTSVSWNPQFYRCTNTNSTWMVVEEDIRYRKAK